MEPPTTRRGVFVVRLQGMEVVAALKIMRIVDYVFGSITWPGGRRFRSMHSRKLRWTRSNDLESVLAVRPISSARLARTRRVLTFLDQLLIVGRNRLRHCASRGDVACAKRSLAASSASVEEFVAEHLGILLVAAVLIRL